MKILILEDNDDRINAFRDVLSTLGDVDVRIWKDAHSMIRDLEKELPDADIISLDHDLNAVDDVDPGDGLDLARKLKEFPPSCPVLIHSTNYERSWSMLLELQETNWDAERHPPIGMGVDWIAAHWIKAVKEKLGAKEGGD